MKPKEIRKLLDQIASAKYKLFKSNVIRSERLTGEIGEYLAELQFPDAKRAGTTSNKGWDLILTDGKRIQVKTHAKGAGNNARWTEVRHLDAFDLLLIVVLSPDYRLREMYQVERGELKKLAKTNDRNVAMIRWDTLTKHNIAPNARVKKCFPSPGSMPAGTESPDPGEETSADEAWELLTGVGCGVIYFAPRLWRTWNVTHSAGGVFKTQRKLVFEYITPKSSMESSVANKISLRGLLEPRLGKPLYSNLTLAVKTADWQRPKMSASKHTVSYAKWTVAATTDHHLAPTYPKGGFPTEQDFYAWLARWDRMIGVRRGKTANTRLWEFIESVKP